MYWKNLVGDDFFNVIGGLSVKVRQFYTTLLLNLSIPDVPFSVLLSTVIRSRFQIKPANCLTPEDHSNNVLHQIWLQNKRSSKKPIYTKTTVCKLEATYHNLLKSAKNISQHLQSTRVGHSRTTTFKIRLVSSISNKESAVQQSRLTLYSYDQMSRI